MAIVKAILLEPVKNHGKTGDIVNLQRGFFRHLQALSKAQYATAEVISKLEKEQEHLRLKDADKKLEAEKWQGKLAGYTLSLVREAGERGELYGSVSARDVAKELLQVLGLMVHHTQVLLSLPLRHIGTYPVTLELHPQVTVEISLLITAHEKEE